MRRGLLAVALTGALVGAGPASAAPAPRASLPAIEREVMCPVCGLPLNVAESPQADRERAFISRLIARGYSEQQIKRALVAQFGSGVLAQAPDNGVGVAAYVVPLSVAGVAAALLALLLPRWRRRAQRRGPTTPDGRVLSPADAERVERELHGFDG